MSTTHAGAALMLEALRGKTLYLALLRSSPSKDGSGGNEVNAASYSRQLMTFSAPANSIMTNDNELNFPQALTNWGTIKSWALYDAVSGGAMHWYGDFKDEQGNPEPGTINTGSFFFVSPGGVKLSTGLTACV